MAQREPILVIMAAGMGSRYGGLKQMDPVGPTGELILDYSLYDARRAGFNRAVVVIKRENEQDFRQVLGNRIARHMDLRYAFQDIDALPQGFSVPAGRQKPWGTGHAVLAAAGEVDAPFCAINADDYYGAEAFRLCYRHLTEQPGDTSLTMVGYLLQNTLSESGFVSRGICSLAQDGCLEDIVERTHIISTVDGPLMTEDQHTYTRLSPDTVVSMNMWGFPATMMGHLQEAFTAFLREELPQDPTKKEFFLPAAVDRLLSAGEARVSVYTSPDKWYGITYQKDRADVKAALQRLSQEGLYPSPLWG